MQGHVILYLHMSCETFDIGQVRDWTSLVPGKNLCSCILQTLSPVICLVVQWWLSPTQEDEYLVWLEQLKINWFKNQIVLKLSTLQRAQHILNYMSIYLIVKFQVLETLA